jgi:hypothetical protein
MWGQNIPVIDQMLRGIDRGPESRHRDLESAVSPSAFDKRYQFDAAQLSRARHGASAPSTSDVCAEAVT